MRETLRKKSRLLFWLQGAVRLFESILVRIIPSRSTVADICYKTFQANLKSFLQEIVNLQIVNALVSRGKFTDILLERVLLEYLFTDVSDSVRRSKPSLSINPRQKAQFNIFSPGILVLRVCVV
jgi:hypothetical protein